MIRTEAEYHQAKGRLAEEQKRLGEHEQRLRATPLGAHALKRALDPLRSFQRQLEEELGEYEQMKNGRVQALVNLHGLGRALVAIRIALGMTQRQLAEQLGVNESQVSRDEKNEYRGITVDRASRILDVLGVRLTTSVTVKPRQPRKRGRNERQRPSTSRPAARELPAAEQIG